jgi:integron integrase
LSDRCSPRAEKAYVSWILRFLRFHGWTHPDQMGGGEITLFLSDLATRRRVSASTQNQALSAVLFLYRNVLCKEPGKIEGVVRARRPKRLPLVLTRNEVHAVLCCLRGVTWLQASLLYGAGLRLMECSRLRVKDVDFSRREILIRDGKGSKDRITLLPETVREPLISHIDRVRKQHQRDLERGFGSVLMPKALQRKYPRSPWEWGWQWVFPATRFHRDSGNTLAT